jgi:O-methyltransferase
LAEIQQPFPDATKEDMDKIHAVSPYTMTSMSRRLGLLEAVRYLVRNQIQGDIVECGVWHGGSMMLAARELLALGSGDRHLYLMDTFEGMPAPEAVDRDWADHSANDRMQNEVAARDHSHMWCVTTLDKVTANMASTGYSAERLHFVKGLVQETLPAHAPERIALLRLDTDWYDSTKHELEHLYPRVVSGGIIIIDDYGYWKGQRQAVDEFLATVPEPLFLHRIDEAARCIVKP